MSEMEGAPHIENSPKLIELEQLTKSNVEHPNTVIYVPPVLGSSLTSDVIQQFSDAGVDLWRVMIHQYGYPQLQEYVDQMAAQLNRQVLPHSSPTDTYIAGYSSGCVLAVETGLALGLPKDHIFSVAPPLPFKEFFQERVAAAVRLVAAMKNSGNLLERTKHNRGYLRQFTKNGEKLHGSRKSVIPGVKKYREGRQWYKVGLDARITSDQLTASTVLSGRRDVLSPHSRFTDISVIHGGHRFEDFVPTITQLIPKKI